MNYFRGGNGTDGERLQADYVILAYNDFIETGLENGITGLMLLAFILVLVLRQARKIKTGASVIYPILGFIVFMNFWGIIHEVLYSSLLFTVIAYADRITNKFSNTSWRMTYLTITALFALISALGIHQYKISLSNYFEAKADNFYWRREYTPSIRYYKQALEHNQGSLFLALKYADLLGAEGNGTAAIKHLRATSIYCFSPDIELRLGQLDRKSVV